MIERFREAAIKGFFLMTTWQEITEAAFKARQLLTIDRLTGEKAFLDLLSKYPQDGMIFYQRACGWETLEEYELAIQDFQIALKFIHMEHWIERVAAALQRVKELQSRKTNLVKNEHDLPLSLDSREIIKVLGQDPPKGCILARRYLELLLEKRLVISRTSRDPNSNLYFLIKTIEKEVRRPLVAHMHTIRMMGNEAAHPSGHLTVEDAKAVEIALVAISKQFGTNA